MSVGRPLADPTLRKRLVALVRENPRQSTSTLARKLGVSRQVVHYHLRQAGYRWIARWEGDW